MTQWPPKPDNWDELSFAATDEEYVAALAKYSNQLVAAGFPALDIGRSVRARQQGCWTDQQMRRRKWESR